MQRCSVCGYSDNANTVSYMGNQLCIICALQEKDLLQERVRFCQAQLEKYSEKLEAIKLELEINFKG